ncbi:MAG: MBOAT family protein [Gammaproteobacteria bacterium]|nr:MBOAT family protein [Gammaproteobacteria bacterium]
MLFSSFIFIFAFLPLTVGAYWFLRPRFGQEPAIAFLVTASLVFYGWWNPLYVPLLMASLGVNYFLGRQLARRPNKALLALGLAGNLALLAWFKYADFLIGNLNLLGAELPLLHLVLPLGISFFTFQKLAYLVDSYRRQVHDHGFNHYALFVTFFPQLIAGPIVHHGEVLPQFTLSGEKPKWELMARGLFLFLIGLSKKLIIADEFAALANQGWASPERLSLLEAWATTGAYSLQLYFDFSAYSDMAMGAALMFNIHLPANFLAPYRALDIADFWRRWHITLGRFLRDYLYIPLGGSRHGRARTSLNLFITFFLSGLWHGAGWTFVLWGAAHGLAVAAHGLWRGAGFRLPKALAWFCTLLFVHLAWVLFRAPDLAAARAMYGALLGAQGLELPGRLARLGDGPVLSSFHAMPNLGQSEAIWLLAALGLATLGKNSIDLHTAERLGRRQALAAIALGVWAVMLLNRVGDFLYFNF